MAKVLVIDDDPQLLQMVGLMLERGGHVPFLEEDPRKGLDRIRQERPDLVVLDVMMPEISGHQLAEQIRSQKDIADLPIMILTARAQAVDREAALASGADGYLSKPVLPEVLLEHIDQLLGDSGDVAGKSGGTSGMVVAFFGMRGGMGRTTLAANVAGALRRVGGQEIGLVDLSSSGGQAAMHFRLQTRSTWATLPSINQLDWDILKEQMLVHQSGVRLLAAPREPQLPFAPSSELTTAVLSLLRRNARFTIFDLPPVMNPAVQTVLEHSDIVFHVVLPEVISVHVARHTTQSLDRFQLELKYKAYILNHVAPEATLPPSAVEKGLRARLAFKVNFDGNQSRALAHGVPLSLTAADSPLATVTRRLAEVLWERADARSDGRRTGRLHQQMSQTST